MPIGYLLGIREPNNGSFREKWKLADLSLGTETLGIDKLCALMAATTSDSVTRDVNGLMTSNCARRRPEDVSCALCQQ